MRHDQLEPPDTHHSWCLKASGSTRNPGICTVHKYEIVDVHRSDARMVRSVHQATVLCKLRREYSSVPGRTSLLLTRQRLFPVCSTGARCTTTMICKLSLRSCCESPGHTGKDNSHPKNSGRKQGSQSRNSYCPRGRMLHVIMHAERFVSLRGRPGSSVFHAHRLVWQSGSFRVCLGHLTE